MADKVDWRETRRRLLKDAEANESLALSLSIKTDTSWTRVAVLTIQQFAHGLREAADAIRAARLDGIQEGMHRARCCEPSQIVLLEKMDEEEEP